MSKKNKNDIESLISEEQQKKLQDLANEMINIASNLISEYEDGDGELDIIGADSLSGSLDQVEWSVAMWNASGGEFASVLPCCIPTIYGCTDSTASNYNPTATVDDGTCNPFDENNEWEITVGQYPDD